MLPPMHARTEHNDNIGVKIALGVVLPFAVIVALCVGLCFYVYRRNEGRHGAHNMAYARPLTGLVPEAQ